MKVTNIVIANEYLDHAIEDIQNARDWFGRNRASEKQAELYELFQKLLQEALATRRAFKETNLSIERSYPDD